MFGAQLSPANKSRAEVKSLISNFCIILLKFFVHNFLSHRRRGRLMILLNRRTHTDRLAYYTVDEIAAKLLDMNQVIANKY